MKARQVYLDTNVLVAYYSSDITEEAKKKQVRDALAVFAQLKGVRLCISLWCITEMVNVLISSKRMDRDHVAQIENQLVNERRLNDVKIDLIGVSPRRGYDFREFFYHVRQAILAYHSGVGDVIHSVIMKNNSVEIILTFDQKRDFKQIPGLTVLHPVAVRLPTGTGSRG